MDEEEAKSQGRRTVVNQSLMVFAKASFLLDKVLSPILLQTFS